MEYAVDVVILGSGFAGALLALILKQIGRTCLVLDRQKHPRFAIGESSTPLADMALRHLARQYHLPRLAPLAKYGEWLNIYPQVMRGLKRGFSYFQHQPGCAFAAHADHASELLVAASENDASADTHWLRSEVDAFFAREVVAAGIPLLEEMHVTLIACERNEWRVEGVRHDQPLRIQAQFVVDGTGEGGLLARFLGIADQNSRLKTNSRALYAHFVDTIPWRRYLAESAPRALADHPFDCDRAALHQVLDGAWMWQLRFDSEVLSAGFAIDAARHPLDESLTPGQEWDQWMARYPSVRRQFEAAKIIAPAQGLRRTGRLQRLASQIAGENWALLPHTAGFIDPLHSTGIAHTLFGVRRLAHILEAHWQSAALPAQLKSYADCVRAEIMFIDRIVANCYQALPDFELFVAASKLYFVATIACEQAFAAGNSAGSAMYLCAQDERLQQAVHAAAARLPALTFAAGPRSISQRDNFFAALQRELSAFFAAGLFDRAQQNMHRHTRAEKV